MEGRRVGPPLQIAIDGPVASGKSTVARGLAKKLSCDFLDTGAFYRAVGYLALERRVRLDDEAAVCALAVAQSPEALLDASTPLGYRIRFGNALLDNELFSPGVEQAASLVAAMPSVREKLVEAQRRFARGRDVVMAGRDIGSVVLPNANFKFFLTAPVATRVERRVQELREKGVEVDPASLRKEIEHRDARDRGRKVSPVIKAPDAIEIDTSAMTVDETVAALVALVRGRRSVESVC